MRKNLSRSLAIALIATAGLVSVPANAGEAEFNRLTGFIGDWRGEGTLVGGDNPEPFRCRLNIAKGNQTRINYSGRCSLINMNLSVSGTIAFNDSAQQYEAAMSSNAGFTGLAVGREQNDRISFDLREQQTDRSGSDVRIGSRIILVGNQITVDFEVEFNDSGDILTASVPFSQ